MVESITNEKYNACLLNLYHNGEEAMGWHCDNEKEIVTNSSIASLSIGASRKFSFKHKVCPTINWDADATEKEAKAAKAAGSNRFCMGAAWREPKDRDIEKVAAMIKGVKALGLETCATLGMLEASQAQALQEAGLDFYNHNLDTSEDFYRSVISTRGYQDRLDTISNVRAVGMSVCCGGIVGMGESREQRAAFLTRLANLSPYPESVPINHLVPVAGTPLADQKPLDPLEFVRTIAVARITMPRARVRLSAGRQELGRAVQAMCFQAGANSIFYGEQLLTTGNPEAEQDRELLAELGLKTKQSCKTEVLV